MHCPSCGNESSLDQKFCRRCGLRLESVSKLVAGHQTPEAIKREAKKNEQDVVRRMYRWMMWGFAGFLIGIVMLVVGKTFALDKIFGLVASLVLLGGTAAAAYGVMSAMRDGVSPSKKLPEAFEPTALSEPDTGNDLIEARVPLAVPSVTERTTELIGDKEDGRAG